MVRGFPHRCSQLGRRLPTTLKDAVANLEAVAAGEFAMGGAVGVQDGGVAVAHQEAAVDEIDEGRG